MNRAHESEHPRPDRDAATDALVALVRGELAEARALAGFAGGERVLAAASEHGLGPLIHHRLAGAGIDDGVLAEIRERSEALARAEAAVEAIRSAACMELVDTLHEAGVANVIFKGTALAHSHYPLPHLRPRDDTDLLVRHADLDAADAVLRDLGYETPPGVEGELASHQRPYTRLDPRGVRHNFDIHWRVSNRHRYAGCYALDELLREARPVPNLGPRARAPGPVDALLIAALHRASNRGLDRIVWLYDVHLLLESMTSASIAAAIERARDKSLLAECAETATLARRAFATSAPGAEPLLAAAAPWGAGPGDRELDIWLADLKALPGWRMRLALLKEHAFPPARYMLHRAGARSRWMLPWLYVSRGVRGLGKLLARRAP